MSIDKNLENSLSFREFLVKSPWTDQSNKFRYNRMRGVWYVEFLSFLQSALNSTTYLEIGVRSGSSLAAMKGKAVVIDPNYRSSLDEEAKKLEHGFTVRRAMIIFSVMIQTKI